MKNLILKLVVCLALLAPALIASPAAAHQSSSHCSGSTVRYSTLWEVRVTTSASHADCGAYDYVNCKRQLPGGSWVYTSWLYAGTATVYTSGSTGYAQRWCPSGYVTHVQQTPWTYTYIL